MNFGLQKIKDTVKDYKELDLIDKGDKGLIISFPEEIINLFKDYSFPTIHHTLEVLLYYSTYTQRIIELDNYMYYLLGDEHMTDITIVKLMMIIEENDLINKTIDLINKQIKDKILGNIYFSGWLLQKSNLNFYTTFDFVVLISDKVIGEFNGQ